MVKITPPQNLTHPIKKLSLQTLTPYAIWKTLLIPPMQIRSWYLDLISFEYYPFLNNTKWLFSKLCTLSPALIVGKIRSSALSSFLQLVLQYIFFLSLLFSVEYSLCVFSSSFWFLISWTSWIFFLIFFFKVFILRFFPFHQFVKIYYIYVT